MLKKLLFAGSIGAALLAAVCGRDAYSYAITSWGWARRAVQDQVPTAFELERARKMIEQLEPEVRHSRRLVAKEEIELERLEGRVAQLVAKQVAERGNLQKLTSDLQSGNTRFVYAGRDYSVDQVQQDVTHRFARFKTNDQTLASLRQVLDSRQRALSDARHKVEEMLALKQQLLAEVSNLEARQKMLEISENSGELAVDDSQLSRTRDLLDGIRAKIEVSERSAVVEHELIDSIPVDQPSPNGVLEEITAYLNQGEARPNTANLAALSGETGIEAEVQE